MMKISSTPDQILAQYVQTALMEAFGEGLPAGFTSTVVKTADARNGDYQCNDAMALAKLLRKAPRDVATAVAQALGSPDILLSVEIAGPGFLNFRLRPEWTAACVEAQMADDRRGVPPVGAGRTVLIDYSSPNVAKPMHIGHIRSTVIGNALDRLHRFCGFKVIADNHLGDWGTQFGLILLGYRNFVNPEALKASPVQELERVYVESYGRSKEDEAWLDAARRELVKLQQGDPENLALWEQFVSLSLGEFEKIYRRLDVRFDLHRGESFYNDALPGVLERLDRAGLLAESEGAQVVDLEEEKLGICIVRKSDGGFNYATTDLATVFSRVREFSPETILYVTDERQQRHFKQFFTVCEKLGEPVKLEHVWFGLMRLPDATFSTRQGNVIKLEVLLDEAERRALELVKSSSPEMPAAQQSEVARAVGLGALKYADLSQNPQSMITFTWEKAMALDGNSAPYLQYAHARIRSVLDKHAAQFPDESADAASPACGQPVEQALCLKLAQFPEAVLSARKHYRPNYLCDYLYELAQQYSSYHQSVPFLKAEPAERPRRMRLIRAVADTLRTGLGLLGIEAPERI